MRIVIDCQALQTGSSYRGIGRYIRGLIKGLVLEKNVDTELFLLVNGSKQDSACALVQEFEKLDIKFLFWYSASNNLIQSCEASNSELNSELLYEAAVLSVEPDVLLVGSVFEGTLETFCLPLERLFRKLLIVSVFYDLIPYHEISTLTAEVRFWYLRCLMRLQLSDLLLCISNFVKNEIHKLISDVPVVNIKCGIDSAIFSTVELDKYSVEKILNKLGVNDQYYLYVGGSDNRKNIPFMIEAFSDLIESGELNKELIIVAGKNFQSSIILKSLVAKRKMKTKIKVLTYLTDVELAVLYKNAELFIFPSIAEGLGFPILEAMAAGIPVISSNTTSMPEIHGWDEGQFSPYDRTTLKKLLLKIEKDELFKKKLRDHSLNQIQNFSWSDTARLAYSAIDKIMPKSRQRIRPKKLDAIVDEASLRKQSDEELLLMAQAITAQYCRRIYVDITYVLSVFALVDSLKFSEIVLQLNRELFAEYEIILFGLKNGEFVVYEWNKANWVVTGGITPKPCDIVLLDSRVISYEPKREYFLSLKRRGVSIALVFYDIHFEKEKNTLPNWTYWKDFVSPILEDCTLSPISAQGKIQSSYKNLNLQNLSDIHAEVNEQKGCLIGLICISNSIQTESNTSTLDVLKNVFQTIFPCIK